MQTGAPATLDHEQILQNPRFQELVKARSGFAWTLSAIQLGLYVGFVLLVAFGKGFLALKVGSGVTSIGIVLGLAVIFSCFITAGIYVQRANGAFDRMTNALKQELGR